MNKQNWTQKNTSPTKWYFISMKADRSSCSIFGWYFSRVKWRLSLPDPSHDHVPIKRTQNCTQKRILVWVWEHLQKNKLLFLWCFSFSFLSILPSSLLSLSLSLFLSLSKTHTHAQMQLGNTGIKSGNIVYSIKDMHCWRVLAFL